MSSVSSHDTEGDDITSQEGNQAEEQTRQPQHREFDETRDWTRLAQVSNENIIAEFDSFYKFLRRLYVTDEIQYPPKSGWPHITVERMKPFNKSDRVVNLLKHLPYIPHHCDGRGWEIDRDTSLFDYQAALQGELTEKKLWELSYMNVDFTCEIVNNGKTFGPDAIGISDGDREFSPIALDVKYGLIYCVEDIIRSTCTQEGQFARTWLSFRHPPDTDPESAPWRCWCCWPIEDFFDGLKTLYSNYKILPSSMNSMVDMIDFAQSRDKYDIKEEVIIRETYQKYGWPAADFDTAACRQEIRVRTEQMENE